MNGKIIGGLLVGVAAVAGGAMYWLQVYAFYDELDPEAVTIRLTPEAGGPPEPVAASVARAIDASSSPLRFRACLSLPETPEALARRYRVKADAVPLTAPGWFECYDAAAIGTALEAGEATAFLGEFDIRPGVDRVVAVFPDGRAYAWHQLNDTIED